MQKIKGLITKNEAIISIVIVILIVVVTYLPLIKTLGIYYDDWHIIFNGRVFGPEMIADLYSIDRPFLGVFDSWLYQVFGDNVLSWNLSAFFFRALGALGMLWLLRLIWPKQRIASVVITSLFVIYPGFLEQSNGITYSGIIYTLTMVIFSLAFTVCAYKTNKPIVKIALHSLASLLVVMYFLMFYEYWIGLEGLRFSLLWYLRFQSGKKETFFRRIKHTVISYAPYAVLAVAFLCWRLFIFESARPTMSMDLLFQKYAQSPLREIFIAIAQLLKDMFEAVGGAWFIQPYNIYSNVWMYHSHIWTLNFVISFLLGLIALGMVLTYYLLLKADRYESSKEEIESNDWAKHSMWIGLIAVVTASIPIVVVGRDIIFGFLPSSGYDRYALPASIGTVLLIGGFLFYTLKGNIRLVFISVLIVASVATQYNASVIFKIRWDYTRQFWWQMTWRAPQLKEDTVLLAFYPNYTSIGEDYHVAYPANLIFYPDDESVLVTSQVLNTRTVESIIMGIRETQQRRVIRYQRDYAHSLVAYFPSENSCLHLIDGKSEIFPPGTDLMIQLIAPFSHIEQIETDQSFKVPPATIFGSEPEHSWCFYYQRGSLAAQQGDWQEVERLGDEILQNGLSGPDDRTEWWPFILGYVNVGRYDTAGDLIESIKKTIFFQYQACRLIVDGSFLPINTIEGEQFLFDTLCIE